MDSMDSMKIEDAIAFFRTMRRVAGQQPLVDASCTMAINALREKTSPPDKSFPDYEELAQAYVKICNHQCVGNNGLGVSPCPFYDEPDFDEFGLPIPEGCRLLSYRCG